MLATAGLAAGGCVSLPTLDLDQYPELPPVAELESVPFHAQPEFHCGPASLLTVLEASGTSPGFEAVAERVYVPQLMGSLQAEMLAAARSFGRIPYRLGPDPAEVFAEVAAGRPVLILQNLGLESRPAWHYAVVVGYERHSNRIVMRSGDRDRLISPARRWMRQWDWAGRWGVVLLVPGELPADPDRTRLLRALADFEVVAPARESGRAWRAVTGIWPDEPIAWLGVGNAAWGNADLKTAEDAFMRVLTLDSGHAPARYNLARVWEQTGHACDALEMVDGLDDVLGGGRVAEIQARLRSACRQD